MPPLSVRGYLAALPAAVQKEVQELNYRAYVTDSLQIISENTAYLAAALSNGEAGKYASIRWAESLEGVYGPQQPEETRTPEEVTAYMLQKLRE